MAMTFQPMGGVADRLLRKRCPSDTSVLHLQVLMVLLAPVFPTQAHLDYKHMPPGFHLGGRGAKGGGCSPLGILCPPPPPPLGRHRG